MDKKEAMKILKDFHDKSALFSVRTALDTVLPELKESEDERIRKEFCKDIWTFIPNEKAHKYIAWLEKQSEQKSFSDVEPKFNVDYWVVNKLGDAWHIDSFDGKNYQVSDGKGNYNYFPISKQDEMRLWTIDDARDGDVLSCNKEILLFKSYSVQGRISLYCWYNGQTGNFHCKEVVDSLLTTKYKVHPAIKEEQDLLFSKMKEAGYKWNAEEKDLEIVDWSKHIMRAPNSPSISEEKSTIKIEDKESENTFGDVEQKVFDELLDNGKQLWSEEDESC